MQRTSAQCNCDSLCFDEFYYGANMQLACCLCLYCILQVISSGADSLVAVTDLTTGESIMSLRGHQAAVCAVAFDTTKILRFVYSTYNTTVRDLIYAMCKRTDSDLRLAPAFNGESCTRIAFM
jgi:hypothetical protein